MGIILQYISYLLVESKVLIFISYQVFIGLMSSVILSLFMTS